MIIGAKNKKVSSWQIKYQFAPRERTRSSHETVENIAGENEDVNVNVYNFESRVLSIFSYAVLADF